MSVGVLFVCLGNVCRSPVAAAMLRQKAQQAGLDDAIHADSCGTAAFNAGKPPDARAVAAAARAGYDIGHRYARQIETADYRRFRYIVAMDRINLINVQSWAPADFVGEIKLLLEYCQQPASSQIADPYYEDSATFDTLVETLEPALDGLLAHIRHQHCM
jgi:protein-tyrosine phosphatase